MEKPNPLREKSYAFSVEIILFCKKLLQEREFIISRQLFRSGTSIGANVEEAIFAQSKKDFIAKLQISLKETAETIYWLRLLKDTHFRKPEEVAEFIQHTIELRRLLISIIKTTKIHHS